MNKNDMWVVVIAVLMFLYLAARRWRVLRSEITIGAAFDLNAIHVVSVERLASGKTCIGYLVSADGEIRVWYLECGEDVHADLVRRFREKLEKGRV